MHYLICQLLTRFVYPTQSVRFPDMRKLINQGESWRKERKVEVFLARLLQWSGFSCPFFPILFSLKSKVS